MAAVADSKAYSSLCAFTIKEDGVDKLSSAPSKFLDPPLNGNILRNIVSVMSLLTVIVCSYDNDVSDVTAPHVYYLIACCNRP